MKDTKIIKTPSNRGRKPLYGDQYAKATALKVGESVTIGTPKGTETTAWRGQFACGLRSWLRIRGQDQRYTTRIEGRSIIVTRVA